MTIETFPQLLNRLAIAHLDRKTAEYIKQLEMVAESAKYVVAQEGDFLGKSKLFEVLRDLPETEGLKVA